MTLAPHLKKIMDQIKKEREGKATAIREHRERHEQAMKGKHLPKWDDKPKTK